MGRVQRVMVIGAGTMGHSIALVFARGGYEVDLMDEKEEALDRGLGLIRASLRILKEARALAGRPLPEIMARIHPTTSLDPAGRADLVIEAISENPKAKRRLFQTLDRLCPGRTIFASNTSYLNLFRLAKGIRPQKMVICHFYAPAHLIPLVDLVKGPQTSAGTVETVKEILLKLGKVPVVMNRFIPGYIVNRLQRAMAREIFFLLDNGYATAEEIDRAVKNSLGIRIPVLGVVQRYDFTGLDLALTFEQNPSIRLVSRDRIPRTLSQLVKKGHVGIKSGRGFYDYSSKGLEAILKERDRKLLKVKAFLEELNRSSPLSPRFQGRGVG
ncbi:MAG: 3-hydroxyacyl-CoA dehydrogenase family protein [Desulfobacterota bacterium]|nr:3-hydroxyacyl-CoA dehydrogenase family protein [Thermodesulfobacteriota bacterium]